jgi:hypothetical protein
MREEECIFFFNLFLKKNVKIIIIVLFSYCSILSTE